MILHQSFYARPAEVVARELLGTILVHETVSGIICETEAYPVGDAASHAFRGKTLRNAAMFEEAGCAYVYRSYGIHWCVNVVTGEEGRGEAVLIRAIHPRTGIDIMRERRGGAPDARLCNGPGNVCQAFGISLAHNVHPMWQQPLTIQKPEGENPLESLQIQATPRIGISQNQEAALRFVLRGITS